MDMNSEVSVAKVVIGLEDLAIMLPGNRQKAFASISPVLCALLSRMERASLFEEEDPSVSKFNRLAKIYIRALATYEANTNEWFKVFMEFKVLFDSHRCLLSEGTMSARNSKIPDEKVGFGAQQRLG